MLKNIWKNMIVKKGEIKMSKIIIAKGHWTHKQNAQKHAYKLKRKGCEARVFNIAPKHWKVEYKCKRR